MMVNERSVLIDFSWATDSEHQGAEAEIVSNLLREGWEQINASDCTRTLRPPSGDDFAQALARVQARVGAALVSEA
jgi:hypothetical protein